MHALAEQLAPALQPSRDGAADVTGKSVGGVWKTFWGRSSLVETVMQMSQVCAEGEGDASMSCQLCSRIGREPAEVHPCHLDVVSHAPPPLPPDIGGLLLSQPPNTTSFPPSGIRSRPTALLSAQRLRRRLPPSAPSSDGRAAAPRIPPRVRWGGPALGRSEFRSSSRGRRSNGSGICREQPG